MKKENGITLVALIITIIVMLILVAVTVSILINSNVIGTAKSAGERTKTAYNNESNFGEELAINIGGTSYNSIDEAINSTPGSVDESEKLYEALQNKTVQEIMTGVNVDGIDTVFVSVSDTLPECTIQYNNQEYIVIFNPDDLKFRNVLLSNGDKIHFWIDPNESLTGDEKGYVAPAGMTFGELITTYYPEEFYTTPYLNFYVATPTQRMLKKPGTTNGGVRWDSTPQDECVYPTMPPLDE